MAATASSSFELAASPAHHGDGSLAALDLGSAAHVVRLDLDSDLAAWLTAVGIGEGDRITVLRRAVFGGPLHVRTASGGEFAVSRSLARSVRVRAA